jgi:hypothetical protein
MDINVLVFLLVFSLALTVLGFMGRKPGWAFLIFMGAIIATVTALALYSDGQLTQTTSSVQVLAAANGNFVSDFNAITVVPVSIAIGELIIAVRRIFKI